MLVPACTPVPKNKASASATVQQPVKLSTLVFRAAAHTTSGRFPVKKTSFPRAEYMRATLGFASGPGATQSQLQGTPAVYQWRQQGIA